jgi:hypothetical protein
MRLITLHRPDSLIVGTRGSRSKLATFGTFVGGTSLPFSISISSTSHAAHGFPPSFSLDGIRLPLLHHASAQSPRSTRVWRRGITRSGRCTPSSLEGLLSSGRGRRRREGDDRTFDRLPCTFPLRRLVVYVMYILWNSCESGLNELGTSKERPDRTDYVISID